MNARRVLHTGDIDLRATMKPIGVYPRDPTTRWTANSFAKAVLTPEGSGTMLLEWDGNIPSFERLQQEAEHARRVRDSSLAS